MSSPPASLGIFDSGLGGLTVVEEIRRLLPAERLVYIGDTAHVPYGPRPVEEVREFSLALGQCLTEDFNAKAIVVACNTAISAAVTLLRDTLPVPVIGIEPGVKPGVQATKTGVIGVLATEITLRGEKFLKLVETYAGDVMVLKQPCPGWVESVEAGAIETTETYRAVEASVRPLLEQGVDVLVLGCTHYPALRPIIAEVAGPNVTIIDTGEAIARRVRDILTERNSLLPADANGSFDLYLTGDLDASRAGLRALLGNNAPQPRRLQWADILTL